MEEKLITIGKIVNTQGHKGEVRVISLTDFPQRFSKRNKVLVNVRGALTEFIIESVRSHKQFVILKFKEIVDMNGAEKLKDSLIQVREKELSELEEGQYYIFQLEGLDVFNEEGKLLGQIKEVFQTGANDVYSIRSIGGKELLIPAIKEVIKEVNLQEKKVVIRPMEEYE